MICLKQVLISHLFNYYGIKYSVKCTYNFGDNSKKDTKQNYTESRQALYNIYIVHP